MTSPTVRDVTLSDIALEELGLITEYLAFFGSGTARAFVAEVERKIDMLRQGVVNFPVARHPRLAEAGYHVALIKGYLLLYRLVDDGGVLVAHVFHQSQDYAALVVGNH